MEKLKVLLVDDEIMMREGFKQLFDWNAHDCEVIGEAADGMEAMNQIDSLLPDIVIMDINIPIMTGLEVIRVARLKYPEMAFVIVSGYDDFSYCQQAIRMKITDYILKPVNYEEFGNVIDNLKVALYEKRCDRKEVQNESGGQDQKMIYTMTKFIQQHMKEDISLKYLADEFHLSGPYISQLFKNEIGVNFLAYLTNIRMEKAKKLLLTTDMPVTEIADEVGFHDYRVFSKVFKKAENATPSQYRKDLSVEG